MRSRYEYSITNDSNEAVGQLKEQMKTLIVKRSSNGSFGVGEQHKVKGDVTEWLRSQFIEPGDELDEKNVRIEVGTETAEVTTWDRAWTVEFEIA